MLTLSIDLYHRLFFVRTCEDFIIKHYPENEMRTPMHMSYGQEHVPVGVCRGLEGKGNIFGSYRSHAGFLAQTMDSDFFFGELYGRTTGYANGKGGSMHLAQPEKGYLMSSGIVASPISVAVGAAFANRELKTKNYAVVFFGDGATDAGSFYESINIASLFKLPVFFICEDNELAVLSRPEERRGYKNISDVISQFDCLVLEDDSFDVESVYQKTQTALAEIKNDPKPVFMNIKCHRYLEHVGIGTDWEYLYASELDFEIAVKSKDALAAQRKRIISQGFVNSKLIKLENEWRAKIENSVERAKKAGVSQISNLYHGVFHEDT